MWADWTKEFLSVEGERVETKYDTVNMEPRYWRPLLISLILFAFALRIHQLDAFSFWQDEGLTTLRSGYSVGEILSNRITIQEGVTKDTHPPAYYLLTHFSRSLLGTSDFSYRYISVLAGVLLVPLLFQLGRRMNGPVVGMLAALVAAVNPLQVWYAQEARMYTLLALLGAAATYVLWRALTHPRLSSPSLIARMAVYFLLAGVAFYTHYTAVFLIAIQSLFWVWLLWRRGLQTLIIGAAVAGFLVALPLIPSTIPRLFTGAETAYSYVAPWIMLQDVIHGFGQGLTSQFDRTGIKFLDLGLLILLLIGLLGSQKINTDRRLSQAFLFVYLLAAVLGLMLGSLIKPMYLGVRHIIIGSPAFILLLARGVSALPKRPYHLAQLVALALILGGSFISLLNLYYEPSFAKDDARALVQHIESRAGENDIVVYNNAILLPLHDHYSRRDDLPVTAIPIYPHQADDRVDHQLEMLTGQYDRLWFVVDPPIDGRDKAGLAASWLDSRLSRIERANFWGVSMLNGVVAYDAGAGLIEALPSDAHPIEESWEGIPALRGTRFDFQKPSSLPTMWIDLFWEAGQEAASDLHLRFALSDVDDHFWFDSSLPARIPDDSSSAGDDLFPVSYGLEVPVGIPPGSYELLVQPWGAGDGAPLGEWLSLTSINIASSDQWPVEIDWPFDDKASLHYTDAVILLDAVPASQEVRPGHTLPLSIYWQAANEAGIPAELRYQLDVIGPDGDVLSTRTRAPGPAWLSPGQWPSDAVILEQSGLYVPPETPPGTYKLRWKLIEGDDTLSGRPSWRPWATGSNSLGSFTVTPWPLETALPASGEVVEAMFGPAIQLHSFDLDSDELIQGDVLDLNLYWQALEAPDESYHVFVHLIRVGDDAIVTQSDKIPVDWLRPTNGWRPGEVLNDRHQLQLPADIKPGEYELYVGLYNPDDELRLPVFKDGDQHSDDRLLLTTIRVLP